MIVQASPVEQNSYRTGLLVEYLGGLHFATAKSIVERRKYEHGMRRLSLVDPVRLRREIQIYLKAGDEYTSSHVDVEKHWISLVGPMRRIDVGILNRIYFRNLPKSYPSKRFPWFGPSLTLGRARIWLDVETRPHLVWRSSYSGIEERGFQALEEFDFLRRHYPTRRNFK